MTTDLIMRDSVGTTLVCIIFSTGRWTHISQGSGKRRIRAVIVVVLTLTRIIKSVVTGQAPIHFTFIRFWWRHELRQL